MIRLGAPCGAAASRRRLALALAAILLVLHWAAPGLRPLDPTPTERAPGYSQAELAPAQGTLPRLLSRSHSLEAAESKSERDNSPPTEDAKAFALALAAAGTARGQTRASAAADTPPRPSDAAAFQARAPPSPRA